MTNDETMTKSEIRRVCGRFVIRHWFIHSSFVIRTSSFFFAASLFAQTPIAPATADWKADAPGVRHKFTVEDLPAPFATESVNNGPREVRPPAGAQPKVPPGFKIEQYASGFSYPRYLVAAPNGDIFVTESSQGSIKVLRDSDGDGKPDLTETFASSGLNKPFGIAFYPPGPDPQFLYVANTNGIVRFPYHNGDTKARGPVEKLSAELSGGGLLRGGGHWTRDVAFSPDGTGQNVFAWGIRNAVGIKFRPGTNELWMSTNERDELGDDLVPEYISQVERSGFYGWPWFYIGNHQDPRHEGKHSELAAKVLVPDVLVQSHSATLNLCFYDGSQFPAEYKGDIFAAFHGSWNRAKRTGYKIVRVPFDKATGQARGDYEDFVTGFVTPEGNVWGRPVGIPVAKDGSLLFSEDANKTIWRVSY